MATAKSKEDEYTPFGYSYAPLVATQRAIQLYYHRSMGAEKAIIQLYIAPKRSNSLEVGNTCQRESIGSVKHQIKYFLFSYNPLVKLQTQRG